MFITSVDVPVTGVLHHVVTSDMVAVRGQGLWFKECVRSHRCFFITTVAALCSGFDIYVQPDLFLVAWEPRVTSFFAFWRKCHTSLVREIIPSGCL